MATPVRPVVTDRVLRATRIGERDKTRGLIAAITRQTTRGHRPVTHISLTANARHV